MIISRLQLELVLLIAYSFYASYYTRDSHLCWARLYICSKCYCSSTERVRIVRTPLEISNCEIYVSFSYYLYNNLIILHKNTTDWSSLILIIVVLKTQYIEPSYYFLVDSIQNGADSTTGSVLKDEEVLLISYCIILGFIIVILWIPYYINSRTLVCFDLR